VCACRERDLSERGLFAVLGFVQHVQYPHARLRVFPYGQTSQRGHATQREVFVRIGGDGYARVRGVVGPSPLAAARLGHGRMVLVVHVVDAAVAVETRTPAAAAWTAGGRRGGRQLGLAHVRRDGHHVGELMFLLAVVVHRVFHVLGTVEAAGHLLVAARKTKTQFNIDIGIQRKRLSIYSLGSMCGIRNAISA